MASSRVVVSIPLLISGKREDGTRLEGTAEAVVVNKHGGKILTREELSAGMQIRIAIVSPYRFQMARVVREEAPGEFSVELHEAENLWGVYFPPDDWEPEPSEIVTSPRSILRRRTQRSRLLQTREQAKNLPQAVREKCRRTEPEHQRSHNHRLHYAGLVQSS